MKFRIFLVCFLVAMSNLNAQSLNQYEYVIIPSEYSFLKSPNQYQLNDMTKFLFDQKGFKTLFDNEERSATWIKDPCKTLLANVENNSTIFSTKLTITLTDCYNKVVFTSAEGKSKIKDYKKGYQDALRKAFKSIESLEYTYEGGATSVRASEAEDDEIVVEEVDFGATSQVVNQQGKQNQLKDKMVEVTEVNDAALTIPDTEELLYAQANKLGFNLIDSSPKVVFRLLNSSKKDVYILQDKKGIFYKDDAQWFAAFYHNGTLIRKEIKVKW
ncbi:hypothetical protein MWU59_04105 [Flavobacteriaceae bacterium F08102]|nr:hypothetical protein [Flavobacteriaceae bacterium F08102]